MDAKDLKLIRGCAAAIVRKIPNGVEAEELWWPGWVGVQDARRRKPEVHPHGAYVQKVMWGKMMDYVERVLKERERERPTPEALGAGGRVRGALAFMERDEDLAHIRSALADAPDRRLLQVLEMVAQGKTSAEAGAVLQVTKGYISRLKTRAIKRVRRVPRMMRVDERGVTVYKWTTGWLTTYGNFKWTARVWQAPVEGMGGRGPMCGPGWIHAYRHPVLAVLADPLHGQFMRNGKYKGMAPVLWSATADVGADDGLKLGCTRLRLEERLEVPELTPKQRRQVVAAMALGGVSWSAKARKLLRALRADGERVQDADVMQAWQDARRSAKTVEVWNNIYRAATSANHSADIHCADAIGITTLFEGVNVVHAIEEVMG